MGAHLRFSMYRVTAFSITFIAILFWCLRSHAESRASHSFAETLPNTPDFVPMVLSGDGQAVFGIVSGSLGLWKWSSGGLSEVASPSSAGLSAAQLSPVSSNYRGTVVAGEVYSLVNKFGLFRWQYDKGLQVLSLARPPDNVSPTIGINNIGSKIITLCPEQSVNQVCSLNVNLPTGLLWSTSALKSTYSRIRNLSFLYSTGDFRTFIAAKNSKAGGDWIELIDSDGKQIPLQGSSLIQNLTVHPIITNSDMTTVEFTDDYGKIHAWNANGLPIHIASIKNCTNLAINAIDKSGAIYGMAACSNSTGLVDVGFRLVDHSYQLISSWLSNTCGLRGFPLDTIVIAFSADSRIILGEYNIPLPVPVGMGLNDGDNFKAKAKNSPSTSKEARFFRASCK